MNLCIVVISLTNLSCDKWGSYVWYVGMSRVGTQVVDLDRVAEQFKALSPGYRSAKPFAHVAASGIFADDVLLEIAAEFPAAQKMAGRFTGEIEGGKFTESDWSKFGPVTQQFVSACNSGPFLRSLSELTGIDGLLADPYLAGGGQHQTGRGGRLKVHSDFNVHPFLPLTRRLNMLVYLNIGWEDSWAGALELWNSDMSEAVVTVTPTLGQVVVFTCTDESFHGLPDPIQCPEGTFRRSLAFYYFTVDGTTPDPRSTMWKERPGEDFLSRPSARLRKSASHARQAVTTLFGM